MSIDTSNGNGPRRSRRVVGLTYALALASIVALATDKYSYGEVEVVAMGVRETHWWQVWASAALAASLLVTVLAARPWPAVARGVAVIEAIGFLTFNAVLYHRDGFLRFVDWDSSHSPLRLRLFVGGILLRLLLISLLYRNRARRA